MLVLFLVASFMAGYIGSLAGDGDQPWYRALTKPALTPPGWVFPVVWNTLYALMGFAAWRVWHRGGWKLARAALSLFFVQLAVNAAWSWVFFGAHAITSSAVVIALLWLLIAATTAAFWQISRAAGMLMLPYLPWVSFAVYLNAMIWNLNR